MEEQRKLTGSEITWLRKKLNLTQEALARKLGSSFVAVNRWENYNAKPIQSFCNSLRRFAKENNIDLEDYKKTYVKLVKKIPKKRIP